MRLFDEFMRLPVLPELFSGARCYFLIGGQGYFQGVKRVEEYSPTLLILTFSKGVVQVTGEGLGICKYCEGDVEVSGKIYGVEFIKKGEKTGV
jgi:hypothetical protein